MESNEAGKRLSLGKDKTESLRKSLGLVPKSRSSVKSPKPSFSGGFSAKRAAPPQRLRAKSSLNKKYQRVATSPVKQKAMEVTLRRPVSVAELAMRMQKKVSTLVEALAKIGTQVTAEEVLDLEMAQLVVEELGGICKIASSKRDESTIIKQEDDREEDLAPRFPVVAVMGHVDHGKTTLLDTLRSSNIAKKEEGGITQDIRAFSVELGNKAQPEEVKRVVFLDTPGHEAFDGVRSKGVELADLVLLIVAADDSVKPQTIDSILYAKKAGKPVVVAVNKCDLEVANPKKVLADLVQYEVIDESLGGDSLSVQISALKGKGLDSLLEALWLQAEVLGLQSNPKKRAKGTVVDSYMEKGRGPSATVLVREGTLKKGDIIVAGSTWGKARSIRVANGGNLMEAGPSMPVQILGLCSLPQMGDEMLVLEKEGEAKALVKLRLEKAAEDSISRKRKAMPTLDDVDAESQKKMFFVVKGAVYASLGSVIQSLENIGNRELKVEVVQGSVGEVGEKDVDLAKAAGAVILAFGTGVDAKAKSKALMEGVAIVYDKIIYRLLDKARELCEEALGVERKEIHRGRCKVIQVFTVSKVGKVAGSEVLEGQIKVGDFTRITRDGIVVCEGELKNLQVNQGQIKEGREGMQCGLLIEGYRDVCLGDAIDVFQVENVQKTLSET